MFLDDDAARDMHRDRGLHRRAVNIAGLTIPGIAFDFLEDIDVLEDDTILVWLVSRSAAFWGAMKACQKVLLHLAPRKLINQASLPRFSLTVRTDEQLM